MKGLSPHKGLLPVSSHGEGRHTVTEQVGPAWDSLFPSHKASNALMDLPLLWPRLIMLISQRPTSKYN